MDAAARNLSTLYLTSGQQLRDMDALSVDKLLGLFARSHLEYNLEQTEAMDDPSLEEMTRAALAVLTTRPNGFVAFIEAGLIDHGHHGNKAREALDETLQLDRAVTAALEMVDLEETLVVVTADHSHAMTINGYPDRGADIFGYGGHGHDGLYYPSIMYGTGPGYKVNPSIMFASTFPHSLLNVFQLIKVLKRTLLGRWKDKHGSQEPDATGGRHDISQDDITATEYRCLSTSTNLFLNPFNNLNL